MDDISKITPVKAILPTALKGCGGIVFTYGVQTCGWASAGVGGQWEKFVQVVSQKP